MRQRASFFFQSLLKMIETGYPEAKLRILINVNQMSKQSFILYQLTLKRQGIVEKIKFVRSRMRTHVELHDMKADDMLSHYYIKSVAGNSVSSIQRNNLRSTRLKQVDSTLRWQKCRNLSSPTFCNRNLPAPKQPQLPIKGRRRLKNRSLETYSERLSSVYSLRSSPLRSWISTSFLII